MGFTIRPLRPALTLLLAFGLHVGCGGQDAPHDPETRPATTEAGARTPAAGTPRNLLPLPGEATIPADHPPTGGDAGGPLQWKVPAGWSEVTPSSSMRLAQYRISGEEGDGECVVFYFGPGQGGDPQANARRWAQQFTQPDGSVSTDRMKLEPLPGGAVPLTLVEVTGIYDGGMTMTAAPPEKKEDWMLLGGIATGPDAPWFFKFTGPEPLLRTQRDAFVGMLESIHPGE